MNNLRKFDTLADYQAATLVKPAVSLIASDDSVYFDPKPIENHKVMVWFSSQDAGDDIVIFNCGSSDVGTDVTSITVNDVAIEIQDPSSDCTLYNQSQASTDYLVKYGLSTTGISDWFSGELGIGGGSNPSTLEVLIPSQIEEIGSMIGNPLDSLVIMSTTPPSLLIQTSDLNVTAIYVPDEALSDYESDGAWQDFVGKLYGLTDYSGNLPI